MVNKARAQVLAALENNDGLLGHNIKLEIGMGDCYLTAAVMEGRLVYVSLTVSRIGGEATDVLPSHQMAVLEASKLDVTKALIECVYRDARELLQRGEWSAVDVIAAWRGTRFDPAGYCRQVDSLVTSPLDAAAQWLDMKVKGGELR